MAETTTKPDAKPVSKPKEKKALSASPTTARLKAQYNEILRAELVKELGLKSISEAPNPGEAARDLSEQITRAITLKSRFV